MCEDLFLIAVAVWRNLDRSRGLCTRSVRRRDCVDEVVSSQSLGLVPIVVNYDPKQFAVVKAEDDLFGRFWIVAYIAVPPLLALALWRQRQAPAAPEPPREPLAPALRGLLLVEALVMLGVGVSLFVAPDTADSLWAWKLTPLTARAIGAFVIGFGLAAAQAAWENDIGRLAGSAYAYATLGLLELVAVLRYSNALDGSGAPGVAYVAFAVLVLLTGVAGSVRAASLQRA